MPWKYSPLVIWETCFSIIYSRTCLQFSEALEHSYTSPALASPFLWHGSTDLTLFVQSTFFFVTRLIPYKECQLSFITCHQFILVSQCSFFLPAYFLQRNSCIVVFGFPMSVHYCIIIGVLCLPYESWNTTDILNISHDGNFCIKEP